LYPDTNLQQPSSETRRDDNPRRRHCVVTYHNGKHPFAVINLKPLAAALDNFVRECLKSTEKASNKCTIYVTKTRVDPTSFR
ncbi:MAG: hypothetical protein ACTSV8_06420, partial [Candidatus Thorarchaeota archaeon]